MDYVKDFFIGRPKQPKIIVPEFNDFHNNFMMNNNTNTRGTGRVSTEDGWFHSIAE